MPDSLGAWTELQVAIHVMEAGRVVEAGPPASVYSNPAPDYTRALLASVPKLRVAP